MIFLKFWFSVCFIFFLHSISQLFEDAKSVKHLADKEYQDLTKFWNFSFCVELNDAVFQNEHFNSSSKNEYKFTVKKLLKIVCLYYFSSEICQNSINLNRSYSFNYHLCFNFKVNQLDTLVRNTAIKVYRIFAYPTDRSEISFYYNYINYDTSNEKFLLTFTIDQINLLGKGHEKDCREYSNENTGLQTKEIVFSKASCLIECLKSKSSRSLSYYYSTRDTEPLILNQDDLEESRKTYWRTVDRNLSEAIEEKCRKLCENPSCALFLYLTNTLFDNEETYRIKLYFNLSPPKPSISDFTFIFNFLSLVGLFFNISVLETVPDFVFGLIKKLLYLKFFKCYLPVSYLRKCYHFLRISTFCFCISLLALVSAYQIVEFTKQNYDVLKSKSFPSEIIPFKWAVCVPVQMFLNRSSELNLTLEKELLASKSFAELENLTNIHRFRGGIEKLDMVYAATEREIKYSINETKVLFKNYDYKLKDQNDSNFLTRCYEIEFDTKEIDKRRYEMLFSLSDLRLKANFEWYLVMPLVGNREMNIKSRAMFSKRNFQMISIKRSSNCKNYQNFNENCSSQSSCINWCILTRFREKHSNLTTYIVAEKSKLNETDLTQIYFNRTFDKQIIGDCSSQFQSVNCYTEYFDIEKYRPLNLKGKLFSMCLYYPHYILYYDPHLTMLDLFLNNLLNFLSIFIGLNVDKLLGILLTLLKKLRLLKILKLYPYFTLLVGLSGFSFHAYILINIALNGDLIQMEEFSESKIIQMPNLIFCFKYDESKIDPNRKLTSGYLDDLTKDLNLNFFQNFFFFDENYDMLDYKNLSKNESLEKLEGVDWFYFRDLKCFEFIFLPINNDRYLYLLKERRVATVTFNHLAILNYYNSSSDFHFYFINKKIETHELNGIDKIVINTNKSSNRLVSIRSNLVVFKQEDIFSYVKQPLSLIYQTVNLNDTTEYIRELEDGFARFNMKTKMTPMHRDSIGLEVNVSTA